MPSSATVSLSDDLAWRNIGVGMSSQLPRQQYGLYGLGGIIVVICVSFGASRMRPVAPITLQSLPATAPPPAPIGDVKAPETPEATEIIVHVAGAVRRPGVVHAKPGARVDDAIRMAGGAKPNADLDRINLALKLVDGSQLKVPVRGQAVHAEPRPRPPAMRGSLPKAVEPFDPGPVDIAYAAPPEQESPYSLNPAPKKEPSPVQSDPPIATTTDVVNLNTATMEELDTLPGVGPATAQKILDFRKERGRFGTVDDLLEVSGIGPKKMEKIRPRVRV